MVTRFVEFFIWKLILLHFTSGNSWFLVLHSVTLLLNFTSDNSCCLILYLVTLFLILHKITHHHVPEGLGMFTVP
jgi:hypothetical protein